MKNLVTNRGTKFKNKLALMLLISALVAGFALPSTAKNNSESSYLGITVVNNSNHEIRHLYLSPVDRNAWGADLLSQGTVVRRGESFAISEATCDGNEIKVIAEDAQGCFLYQVVGCAQANTSWTITDETVADCGQ